MRVVVSLQELIHELRITNQMMYLHPPVEAARESLHQEMFAWEAVVLQLPRVQHSRYQVVQESGSAADTTYKTLLAKLDSDVLDAAYGAVENLIGGVNNYVKVRQVVMSVAESPSDN